MKIKLDAEFVKQQALLWLAKRNTRISIEYGKAIDKKMKRSFSNLWFGRSEEKAIKWLNTFYSGFSYSYWDNLNDQGLFRRMDVEDVLKAADLSIKYGDGLIWIDEDKLFFLEN